MAALPKGLKPVVENYAIGAPDGVMRTEVAGGMPRVGLQWDRGVQQYRVTLVLTPLQFSVWTTFFHHSIKKGALAFDMDLDGGYGVQQRSVSIVPGTYSAVPTGGRALWTVGFMVEAESPAYDMSAADAEALLALYELERDGSSALLDRINVFANQDTLVLQ